MGIWNFRFVTVLGGFSGLHFVCLLFLSCLVWVWHVFVWVIMWFGYAWFCFVVVLYDWFCGLMACFDWVCLWVAFGLCDFALCV